MHGDRRVWGFVEVDWIESSWAEGLRTCWGRTPAVVVHSSAIACGMISTKGMVFLDVVMVLLECDFVVVWKVVVEERRRERVGAGGVDLFFG